MEEGVIDDGILAKEVVPTKEFNFPLELEFKIGTLSNDFIARDAGGKTIAYVRQKLFKFKEAVQIFTDDSKKDVLYTIAADRIIDFRACYGFKNAAGENLGKVGRKGMKSLWKATYNVFDEHDNQEFTIQEENPWAKMGDALLGEIPVVNFFTGYMCNPRYTLKRPDGTLVARLSKEKSFWGRRFKLEKLGELEDGGEDDRMLLSFMMMVLLERRRG